MDLVCSDIDEFRSRLQGSYIAGQLLIKSRTCRPWTVSRVELAGMSLDYGTNPATLMYSGGCLTHHICYVPLVDGIHFEGRALATRDIAWIAPDNEFDIRREQPGKWLAVAFEHKRFLQRVASRDAGIDVKHLERNSAKEIDLLRRRQLGYMTGRLLALHRRDPSIFSVPSVVDALCDQFIDAYSAACSTQIHETHYRPIPGRPRIPQRTIWRRTIEFIETHDGNTLQVADLCRGSRVSWRTLNSVFHSYAGMSPHRYLMLRRLHAIYADLKRPLPDDTVTAICARHGVWDIGRLAAQFRLVFGEIPSEVLNRRNRLSRPNHRFEPKPLRDSA